MIRPLLLGAWLYAASSSLVSAARLVNFQVNQPPVVPKNAKLCTIKIAERDFAWSYGLSEVVQYTPPTDCGIPGSWAAVTLNFTVTSNGTQYDRLGHFTFQNVEIWRTSTPEPTRGDGIIWTYLKDVTRFTPLFAKPGPFIVQLDNIVQTGLDGVYSTVLYATFYASSPRNPPAQKADLIIPIASLKNDTGGEVSVPPSYSLNVTLPRNTAKVFAEISASGNAQEEFWYFNAANDYIDNLPPDTTYGEGPFREARILIDGQVAGAAYPYATFFTGAFSPPAWRPIPSYGALDLPTYFVDLTPFVPVLADGKPHTFSIDVASVEADHGLNQNWWISASLQVFLDSSSKPTIGKITKYEVTPYSQGKTTGTVGDNGDVSITVTASRKVHIESTIITGSGKINNVVFTQDLSFSNIQNYKDNTLFQTVEQVSDGRVLSTHNGVPTVVDKFHYPVNINFTVYTPDFQNWTATFDHSYVRDLLPLPIETRSSISTRQIATGFFQRSPNGNYGNGTNSNIFSYQDAKGNTYTRKVDAALNKITFDQEGGSLAPAYAPSPLANGGSIVSQGPSATEASQNIRLPGAFKAKIGGGNGSVL